LTFNIYDEHNTTLHTQTAGTPNNWNISYTVEHGQGAAYIWGINGNNTRYEYPVVQSQIIRFGSAPTTNFALCPEGEPGCLWNQWVALGVIFITATLFGRASIKYASAIVVLLTIFFVTIQWLQPSWLLLSAIAFFGFIFYLRYADQESDM
jgi:hypothetical protein